MSWLAGWGKRKSHVVNQQAGTGTDYQVQVKVYYDSVPPEFTVNGWDATFHNIIHPAAYYYNGKTYIVYMGGGEGDPWIVSYNHTTRDYSDPVKVGDSAIPADNHGAPSIVVTDDGYIHVFFGCHGSLIQHRRSTNSEDITAWTTRSNIVGSYTYPVPIKVSNGDVYLYARCHEAGGANGTFRKSTDNCLTWDAAHTTIISCETVADDIYLGSHEYDATNNRIHLAWAYLDDSARTYQINVYHAYLNVTTGNLHSMDGTNLGTEITYAEANANCRAYDSGAQETGFQTTMCLDSNKLPFIVFAYEQGVNDWRVKSIRWTGSAWTSPVEITGGGHSSPHIGFNIRYVSGTGATATLEVFRRRWTGTTGMIKVTSTNGGTTWGSATLILEDDVELLFYAWVPENYVSELQWVFAEHNTTTKAYGYGEDGFVTREPHSVGLDGKCKTDFGDVRFTDNDGITELDYWMEEKVDSDYAVFWVEVADSLESSNVTVYIYYGKADATTTSNGITTFLFYENFDGSSVPPNGWSLDLIGIKQFSEDQANSHFRLYSFTSTQAAWTGRYLHKTIDEITGGFWVKAKVSTNVLIGGIGQGITVLELYKDTTLNYQIGFYDGWDAINGSRKSTITTTANNSANGSQNGAIDLIIEISKDGASGTAKTYYDGNEQQSKASVSATFNKIRFDLRGARHVASQEAKVDYIWIRKYIDPEPTHGAWGDEEEATATKPFSGSIIPLLQVLEMI